MRRWISRLLIGMVFAGPMALVSFAMVRAEEGGPATQGSPILCQSCHPEFYKAWVFGSHGNATSDPTFLQSWQGQGSPKQCLACHASGYDPSTGTWQAGGVACESCHSPIPANHPQEPMPAERSAKLCGECHTETYFEWQVTKHRQVELECIGCHDVHMTSLREEDSSVLCANCHRLRASNFAHSEHSDQGLACADCHLGPLDSSQGEGHSTRDHSFAVRLESCDACHSYKMHDPSQVHPEPRNPEQANLTSTEDVTLSLSPSLGSPIGFAAISGLVGMATGMILAPWLERWYKRLDRDA